MGKRLTRLGAYIALGGGIAFSPVNARSAPEIVTINAILPLTGPAAFLGKQEQVALQLGERVINSTGGIAGRHVSFQVYDDQTNPQLSAQIFQQINASKPTVVIGPSSSSTCGSVAPLVPTGPVVYCLSPGIHPDRGSYVFTSSVDTKDTGTVQLRYMALRGLHRVALISTTDASGQDADRGFMDMLKDPEFSKLEIVAQRYLNPTDLTADAQIAQIKAARPQVLVVHATGTPIATVLRAAYQAGLNVPVFLGYGNMTYAQMDDYATFLPKELLFVTGIWPYYESRSKLASGIEVAQKSFYETFASAGLHPDVSATLVWDPMMLIVDALRKLGPDATAAKLRDYLANLRGYAGVNGMYDFPRVPQRGLGITNVEVTRWDVQRRTWVVVSKPAGVPLLQ